MTSLLALPEIVMSWRPSWEQMSLSKFNVFALVLDTTTS